MKYLTIVTFLLLIHISAAIINAAEYTSGYNFQPNEADFIEIKDQTAQSYLQNAAIEDTSVSFGFGDFFRGIFMFVNTVWWGIVSVKGTIANIMCGGIDCNDARDDIARYISYIIYFIYVLGLAQFISNRASKGMA